MNKDVTFCNSIEERNLKLIEWCKENGGHIIKTQPTNKWTSICGSDCSISGIQNPDSSIAVKRHSTNKKHTFFLKIKQQIKAKSSSIKITSNKVNCTEEFNKLSDAISHPYLQRKEIDPTGLGLKVNKGDLCIPAYTIENPKEISSWQKILPKKIMHNGKLRDKFWREGVIGGTPIYWIGSVKKDKPFYLAEGFATAHAINKITGCICFLSFGKGNIEAITKYLLKKYHNPLCVCLDNDGKETLKLKIAHTRLKVIAPGKRGDFWDYRDIKNEQDKLINIFKDDLFIKGIKVDFIKDKSLTEIHWLIKNFIEGGGICVGAGMPGFGKSTLYLKLAILNSKKEPFWSLDLDTEDKKAPKPPIGDGRPSLYLCKERKPNSTLGRIFANGGTLEDVKVLTKFNNESINLSKPEHLDILISLVNSNKYAFCIIDPWVEIALKDQNANDELRAKLTYLCKKIENSTTAIVGIAHLKKDKKNSDDLGSIRGASELVNVATSVLKIKKIKDEEQCFLLEKLKVTESSNGTKGGLKFKINSVKIDDKLFSAGAKKRKRGGIEWIEYINLKKEELDKLCEDELPTKGKETFIEKIERVIGRLEAEGKELSLSLVKRLAKAEGVSLYFLERTDIKWSAIGYEVVSKGSGKDYKKVLKKLPEKDQFKEAKDPDTRMDLELGKIENQLYQYEDGKYKAQDFYQWCDYEMQINKNLAYLKLKEAGFEIRKVKGEEMIFKTKLKEYEEKRPTDPEDFPF